VPDAVFGVIVTGNIVIDTIVRPVTGITWGATHWVDEIAEQLGGNGASTASALAILGTPAKLVGWVGQDALGDRAVAALVHAGVSLEWVTRGSLPTASTIALVAPAGLRSLLHRPGVSLEGGDAPIEFTDRLIDGVRHFHLANPFSMNGLRRHAPASLRNAKQAGLTTSLDTGWDAKGEWRKVLDPCLSYVDVLFVNETEAEILERDGERLAAPVVVKKLGGQGCEVNGEKIAAYAVDAVDTTGAGDCFAGGFLSAWLRGSSLSDAGRFANAVGALSVSRLGSITGLLSYEETLAWMRRK